MKRLFFSTIILFASFASANPQFIDLKSGEAQYEVGERAVLLASVRTSPTDPGMEVHLEATWNSEKMKLTKFSDTEFAVVTPAMPDTNPYHWEVKAYLQDRDSALNLNSSIALIQKENILLNQKHALETDPDKKALLLQAISENEALILGLRSQLELGRTLVETKELYIYPVQSKKAKKLALPLEISTDKIDNIFTVGEAGNITFTVNPSELSETYEFDSEVEAQMGATQMSVTKNSEVSFQSYLDTNGLAVGYHSISATLFIRNKRDANSLLDAINKAAVMKAKTEQLRDGETSAAMIAYYQREIDDLTAIIAAFYGVYAEMRTSVATASLNIEIVEAAAPSPVYIDMTQMSMMEGGGASYYVSLTTEPTADVTIVATSMNSRLTFPGGASQKSLVFTSSNWSVPQEVYFSVPNNMTVDGDQTMKITHTAAGGDYDGVPVPEVAVYVVDDEYPGYQFSIPQVDLSLSGTQAQYGVSLIAEPAGTVEVTIDTSTLMVNGNYGTPVVLTFTPSNWNQSQDVTVEVPPGSVLTEYDYYHLNHSASSQDGYNGVSAGMVFWVVP